METIVDGNKIAEGVFKDLRYKISQLKAAGRTPRLVVVLVGTNPASINYVNAKQRRAQQLGLEVEIKKRPENISQRQLVQEIQELNQDPKVSGIIVQLPLPEHLDKEKILDSVSPEVDVDCLTTANREKLAAGEEVKFLPPAPQAILRILEDHRVMLRGKSILIVGAGELVGKPLSAMLSREKIKFYLADSQTKNLPELLSQADIVISGVGHANLIRGEMIKAGAVVIDAGTAGEGRGEIHGDVDFPSVVRKAKLVAPVPGGVGPVTIAMLFKNVIDTDWQKR